MCKFGFLCVSRSDVSSLSLSLQFFVGFVLTVNGGDCFDGFYGFFCSVAVKFTGVLSRCGHITMAELKDWAVMEDSGQEWRIFCRDSQR